MLLDGLLDRTAPRPSENVGADFDRYRALGVFADSDAGDAEGCGFFLDASGVGYDDAGVFHQAEKVEISLGREDLNSCGGCEVAVEAVICNLFLCAGMSGEDDSVRLREVAETF